jgi:hypothetical protein
MKYPLFKVGLNSKLLSVSLFEPFISFVFTTFNNDITELINFKKKCNWIDLFIIEHRDSPQLCPVKTKYVHGFIDYIKKIDNKQTSNTKAHMKIKNNLNQMINDPDMSIVYEIINDKYK